MTAEEFMNQEEYEPDSGISFSDYHGDIADSCQVLMIEFAKYHVKKALEAASEVKLMKVQKWDARDPDNYEVDQYGILEAYPESNIK